MDTKYMMNNPKYKIALISVLGAILLLAIIYLVIFGRALSQPENHLAITLALPKVILSSEAVRIDDKTYLAKDSSSFIKAMERQEFTFVEQMGSGYFFKKNGDNYISVSRMYSSHFMVFTIPSLQIANFEQCVRAGYSVGESYPRQCWTPDGRHFVEEIKQNKISETDSITVSGKIICLPKIGSTIQTMECAIGLQSVDGKRYGLKNLSRVDPQNKLSQIELDVQISGIFSSEEMKGPDGNKYDIVGVIDVDSITKTVTTITMSESKAIETIKNQFPELRNYPSNNLPPKSIKTEKSGDGWYVAFVQEGSGRPIISAKCYLIDNTEKITSTGVWSPKYSEYGFDDISIINCQPKEANPKPGGQIPNVPGNPVGGNICALETCHGYNNISCGSNPPDACTEMYMVGDKCLQYAKCGVQNGTCQQIQNPQFTECKSCVQKCIDINKDDNIKMFECESKCN